MLRRRGELTHAVQKPAVAADRHDPRDRRRRPWHRGPWGTRSRACPGIPSRGTGRAPRRDSRSARSTRPGSSRRRAPRLGGSRHAAARSTTQGLGTEPPGRHATAHQEHGSHQCTTPTTPAVGGWPASTASSSTTAASSASASIRDRGLHALVELAGIDIDADHRDVGRHREQSRRRQVRLAEPRISRTSASSNNGGTASAAARADGSRESRPFPRSS